MLYPILDRMMGEGWLEDHCEEHAEGKKRPPRRYDTLTDEGRAGIGAVVRKVEREQRFAGMSARFA